MPDEKVSPKLIIVRDRRAARYRLATLLTEEQFSEALRLAKEWHEQGLIQIEDKDFVENIVRAALEV